MKGHRHSTENLHKRERGFDLASTKVDFFPASSLSKPKRRMKMAKSAQKLYPIDHHPGMQDLDPEREVVYKKIKRLHHG